MNVAVQVYSYRERELNATLNAYAGQHIPGWVDEVSYEAVVTPEHESVGMHMADQARQHPVFEYVEAPPGKLSARNYGHQRAVDSGADVLLVGDADAPPIGDNSVKKLLTPIYKGDAIATNSHPVGDGFLGLVTNIASSAEDIIRPHINGQAHAMTAGAWEYAGPFKETDQTDIGSVRMEEEFEFYRRLSRYGRVTKVWNARFYNDTRRTECRLGLRDDDFCSDIGVDTF